MEISTTPLVFEIFCRCWVVIYIKGSKTRKKETKRRHVLFSSAELFSVCTLCYAYFTAVGLELFDGGGSMGKEGFLDIFDVLTQWVFGEIPFDFEITQAKFSHCSFGFCKHGFCKHSTFFSISRLSFLA